MALRSITEAIADTGSGTGSKGKMGKTAAEAVAAGAAILHDALNDKRSERRQDIMAKRPEFEPESLFDPERPLEPETPPPELGAHDTHSAEFDDADRNMAIADIKVGISDAERDFTVKMSDDPENGADARGAYLLAQMTGDTEAARDAWERLAPEDRTMYGLYNLGPDNYEGISYTIPESGPGRDYAMRAAQERAEALSKDPCQLQEMNPGYEPDIDAFAEARYESSRLITIEDEPIPVGAPTPFADQESVPDLSALMATADEMQLAGKAADIAKGIVTARDSYEHGGEVTSTISVDFGPDL